MVMVLSPEGDEEAVESAVRRVESFVAGVGGAMTERDDWGLRRLAYPIKDFQEGAYVLTRFRIGAGDVSELDRILRASEDVLRHLITQPDKSELTEGGSERPEPRRR